MSRGEKAEIAFRLSNLTATVEHQVEVVREMKLKYQKRILEQEEEIRRLKQEVRYLRNRP